MNYDKRHGGPWDRGSADAYYGRMYKPHYFLGPTYETPIVELSQMTPEEIAAYTNGFYTGFENTHERKDYGTPYSY